MRRHANSQRQIQGPGDQSAPQPAGPSDDGLRQGEPLQRVGQPGRFRGVRRAGPLCRDGFDQLRVRLAGGPERHVGGDQPGALQFHPADRGAARYRTAPCGQGECLSLPEELHQTVRHCLFGCTLRSGGQRGGR